MATHKYDAAEPWWDQFFLWRGLPQLTEVVSMENATAFDAHELTTDEWNHVAPHKEVRNGRLICFSELRPLINCVARLCADKPLNLLWVCREPVEQPVPPPTPLSFEFLGCDLIDEDTTVSALTNCGLGFPAAFAEKEISPQGLIRTLERAKQVQRALRKEYPGEPHAHCGLWAIFRCSESRPTQILDTLLGERRVGSV